MAKAGRIWQQTDSSPSAKLCQSSAKPCPLTCPRVWRQALDWEGRSWQLESPDRDATASLPLGRISLRVTSLHALLLAEDRVPVVDTERCTGHFGYVMNCWCVWMSLVGSSWLKVWRVTRCNWSHKPLPCPSFRQRPWAYVNVCNKLETFQ